MTSKKKLTEMMEQEDKAIINALTTFLSEANKASYAINDKGELISEFFEIQNDGDGVTYIHLKTPLGLFSHGYTLDIEADDTENLFERIKAYSKRILYSHYGIDA